MKKRLFSMICVALLAALSVSLAACGVADVYGDLEEDGYSVKVRFEPCGAVVNETQNVTIVEVYNKDDTVTVGGKSGIKLLAPDDQRRGDATFRLAMNDGENNYFSPGWYRERTLRVDESGEALDAYGIPCSVSGREQGYVYSGRWDFDSDVVDPESLEDGEFTLYAAWIPFFSYEIYSVGDSEEPELLKTVNKLDFTFPEWNERTGKVKMNDMPKVNGKTFYAAYSDPGLTQEITETIDGDGTFVDLEKGIALETVVKIYTTWLDGEYIKISDAEQLVEELADEPDEKFILGADIDLSEVDWRGELFDITFTGVLLGDGHSICNAQFESGEPIWDVKDIFGAVGDGAVILDVTMSDVCDENG